MPFGLIHYNTPGDTFEDFVKFASDSGFDCVEVMIGDVWPKGEAFDLAYAEKTKEILEKHGIFASALTAANDFVQVEPAAIQEQVDRMQQVAQLAQIIGVDVLRTEGGQPKDIAEEKWSGAIADCLKACLPFCEDMKIKLAVDNHGLVSNNPAVLLPALEAVSSPFIGSNLDTMNLRWWGNELADLPGIYNALAPYVFHTHMKDGSGVRGEYRGAALGDGEIPLMTAVNALVEAGYKGSWTAEWEGKGDKAEGYQKCLAWLKANCPGN